MNSADNGIEKPRWVQGSCDHGTQEWAGQDGWNFIPVCFSIESRTRFIQQLPKCRKFGVWTLGILPIVPLDAHVSIVLAEIVKQTAQRIAVEEAHTDSAFAWPVSPKMKKGV